MRFSNHETDYPNRSRCPFVCHRHSDADHSADGDAGDCEGLAVKLKDYLEIIRDALILSAVFIGCVFAAAWIALWLNQI